MSEQIREQVSAFLDGELPNTETELLLKRLTRDGELRESFGRYALIGEAMRGTPAGSLSRGFASRVNLAIDGEPVGATAPVPHARAARWWKPLAGTAVAAGVAAVAIVALQQRAISPAGQRAPLTAQSSAAVVQPSTGSPALPVLASAQGNPGVSHEALSYTVPISTAGAPAMLPAARLTNYVFAHSKYSSGLGQRGVLADLLIDDDEPVVSGQPPAGEFPVSVAPATRFAP